MRKLADDDGKRVKLVWGAMTLLVWIAVVWVSWWISRLVRQPVSAVGGLPQLESLASCAGYISSHIEHIIRDLSLLEWVLRWVAIPAKVIPYAVVLGAVGMAAAFAENLANFVELAVVVGSGSGSAGRRVTAQQVLCRWAERDGIRSGLARGVEAGCELLAGGGQLGFFAGDGWQRCLAGKSRQRRGRKIKTKGRGWTKSQAAHRNV